jgi:hypothetical protein
LTDQLTLDQINAPPTAGEGDAEELTVPSIINHLALCTKTPTTKHTYGTPSCLEVNTYIPAADVLRDTHPNPAENDVMGVAPLEHPHLTHFASETRNVLSDTSI